MTRYSVLLPFLASRPEQALPVAGLVRYGAPHRLWQGQSLLVDSYQLASHLAGAGFRVPLGFGVTLMPLRHPFEAAIQARSVASVTGHGVVAGFGPGGVAFQRRVLGAAYPSQLGAVREYVSIVGDLLRDGATERRGEYYSCQADLPPRPGVEVEIGLGVLRPGMARLAGELADVAITWLTPAGYLAEVLGPALAAGADTGGRGRPRLVAMVPMALDQPGRDPLDVVLAGNLGHLWMPHYQDMLRRAGMHVDPTDPRRSAKEVLAGGAFLAGGPAEVAEGLAGFAEAGVDEVVLNLTGVCLTSGLDAALAETRAVLEAVA